MCFGGGGDGGDAGGGEVLAKDATGVTRATGVRGGRGDRGGRAEAAGLHNALDQIQGVPRTQGEGMNRGEIAPGATFKQASWLVGRMFGDTRSDQDASNDRKSSAARERGDETFVDAMGNTRSVTGYTRNFSPPTAGSLLDFNQPPSTGSIAGTIASTLIGGLPGLAAGQIVKGGVNYLGQSIRMSTGSRPVGARTSARYSKSETERLGSLPLGFFTKAQ